VELYVYDLSQGLARQLSTQFLGKAIEGIWHTGVGVYGKEYYFGGGIQSVPLKQSPYGNPVQVAELGTTQVPQDIFEEYLREIQPRYSQETYSLMKHNCNNFSDEVCQFLVGTGIPEYILRLPEEVLNSPMGPMLRPMIENLETTLRYGGVPGVPYQTAAAQPMPNFANIQLPTSMPFPAAPSRSSRPPQPISVAEIHPAVLPSTVPTPPKANVVSFNSKQEEQTIDVPQPAGLPRPSPPANDSIAMARAKALEEIQQEFARITASRSISANEAAALAIRHVQRRHKLGNVPFSQS
jgi:hypothetical protein